SVVGVFGKSHGLAPAATPLTADEHGVGWHGLAPAATPLTDDEHEVGGQPLLTPAACAEDCFPHGFGLQPWLTPAACAFACFPHGGGFGGGQPLWWPAACAFEFLLIGLQGGGLHGSCFHDARVPGFTLTHLPLWPGEHGGLYWNQAALAVLCGWVKTWILPDMAAAAPPPLATRPSATATVTMRRPGFTSPPRAIAGGRSAWRLACNLTRSRSSGVGRWRRLRSIDSMSSNRSSGPRRSAISEPYMHERVNS